MGCCCSKKKLHVRIVSAIAVGCEFDYLRPNGRIILKMDSVSMMFLSMIYFLMICMLTVAKIEKAHKNFLRIERTPSDTPPIVSDDNSFSLDTVHWNNVG